MLLNLFPNRFIRECHRLFLALPPLWLWQLPSSTKTEREGKRDRERATKREWGIKTVRRGGGRERGH